MVKRMLDIVLSSILLFVTSPLLLFIMFRTYQTLGMPVFYLSERPGKNDRLFTMIKFRTMAESRDGNGNYLPDDKRTSDFGALLRTTSLDELPELWNVLKGEMSLVGPRPLLSEYLSFYSDEQKRRHDVRPGITGWAQVNGRNAISWEEKFNLDLWYIKNQSLMLDVTILFLTFKQVMLRKNIVPVGKVAMPFFKGPSK